MVMKHICKKKTIRDESPGMDGFDFIYSKLEMTKIAYVQDIFLVFFPVFFKVQS